VSRSTRSSSLKLENAIALVLNYPSDQSKPRTVRERQRREVIERIKEGGE
jgi:hypothetical protein